VWHYTKALKDLMTIWGNYLWFTFNFFSIRILCKTFFLPYVRFLETTRAKNLEEKNKKWHFLKVVFGMILRGAIIISGLFFWALVLIFGFTFFLLWLLLPFILLVVLFVAVVGLIK
jgi:hypothetical protein